MIITSKTKERPKWHQLRWKLSNLFVHIGKRIYPENPEVKEFIMQVLMDKAIYGQSITRVNPTETWIENNETHNPRNS